MAEESTNEMKKKEMQLGARWLVEKERIANQKWVWNRGEKEYKIHGNFHEKGVEKIKTPWRGIEPRSSAWQAEILATILPRNEKFSSVWAFNWRTRQN